KPGRQAEAFVYLVVRIVLTRDFAQAHLQKGFSDCIIREHPDTAKAATARPPGCAKRRSRAGAVSIPSVSFWRQDVSWYIQQQSWTQSFYQSDRNWTEKLSGSPTSAATAQTNQSGGSASIADAKIVTLSAHSRSRH